MEDLISVIVPVYNSEEYISSCVESVLAQFYSAFELILIDDGSKDHSLEICEALCRKDARIRLVKQDHRGVSAARNRGIEAAKGKYLFFLDSDDMIHPQLLEALYKLQKEKHTVITDGGMHYGTNDACLGAVTWETDMNFMPRSFYLDNKKALKNISKVVNGIGGKMILRRAIKSVRFMEKLSYGEDTLFIYQLLAKGAEVSFLYCNWYYYRIHGDNASRKYSPESCQDRYKVECYIRNSEMQNGRRGNAIYTERLLVSMMMEWHETGRVHQNVELMKYIKNLANKERRLKIFHQLDWQVKLYFYLTIYCYPFLRAALKGIKGRADSIRIHRKKDQLTSNK